MVYCGKTKSQVQSSTEGACCISFPEAVEMSFWGIEE